jgi:hypothetical protein
MELGESMQVEKLWGYLRVGVLGAALAVASFALPSLNPLEPVPVVQAGDKEEEDEEDNEDTDPEAEGREVKGQVIGVYNPDTRTWSKGGSNTTFDETILPGTEGYWQLRIGQIGDVIVPVVVYSSDEIHQNGVSLGDHISVDGEYQGGTFFGTDIEVEDQF